jgi:hypothetical protein
MDQHLAEYQECRRAMEPAIASVPGSQFTKALLTLQYSLASLRAQGFTEQSRKELIERVDQGLDTSNRPRKEPTMTHKMKSVRRTIPRR